METLEDEWETIGVVNSVYPTWILRYGPLCLRASLIRDHAFLDIVAECHPSERLSVTRGFDGERNGTKCGSCGVQTPYLHRDQTYAVTGVAEDRPLMESWARVHFDPVEAVLVLAALEDKIASLVAQMNEA